MGPGPAKKKKRSVDSCFLCGAQDAFRSGYEGYGTGARKCGIYFCEKCRLGRTGPVLDEAALRELYSTSYRQDDSTRFFSPIEKLIRILRVQRCRMVERYAPAGKGAVLDVGCGRGDFPALMAERGWKAAGLELDRRIVEHGIKAGLDLRAADLKEAAFPDGSFDAVTYWHVFEHIRDPEAALIECRRILKPGGLLVLAVPNAGSLQARLSGRHWFHLDPPYHLYHYSLKNIEELLRKTGYSVSAVRHFSLEYNPYGYLQSLFNMMGFRTNLLYDFLRSKSSGGFKEKLGLAMMVILAPVVAPLSFILSLAEAGAGLGGTIEVYARKN